MSRGTQYRYGYKFSDLSISVYAAITILIVFIVSSFLILYMVRADMRHKALHEAEVKARILLDRNLAVHAYFSHMLQPAVFPLAEKSVHKDYFDPTWMSTTFVLREIDKQFRTMNPEDYYFKESAINARSRELEADPYERAFIKRLNSEPDLEMLSEVRLIKGMPYLSVIRRGEVMEESCLRCHGKPEAAPKGLVDTYGPDRSFNRSVNEVVSAMSIRAPLDRIYKEADSTAYKLSFILISTLGAMLTIVFLMLRKLIFKPLKGIEEKAIDISTDESMIGAEIPLPPGKEMALVSESFNRMSKVLRYHYDNLENIIDQRTVELKKTTEDLLKERENVKVLRGLLPICMSCKKIRDDKGYWNQIEIYITEHSEAFFSHDVCPDCLRRLYPDTGLHKDDRHDS